jgi:glycosyltransferase involved in cell wall biosynthesis
MIPNTYPEPEHELGRVEVADPPTLTFIGQQTYGPNADGSAWLVEEVLPHLRALVPDVRLRVVGDAPEGVRALGLVDAVTVTGLVPDVADELARADVAVVPIRYGGGTRIKILEAFAHRIPVVSTTVGAEGLDVQDGEHLLIADDPQSFAKACATLLTDVELRRRLVAAAHDRWSERYTKSAMVRQVADLAQRVLALSGTAR